jgi:hypothetical protein
MFLNVATSNILKIGRTLITQCLISLFSHFLPNIVAAWYPFPQSLYSTDQQNHPTFIIVIPAIDKIFLLPEVAFLDESTRSDS